MSKISVILTAAIALNGQVVQPSDEPIEIEKNLASQLIGNGKAKLPPQDDDPAEDGAAKLAVKGEAAAQKRIDVANALADQAEKDADARIAAAQKRAGGAETDADQQVKAAQQRVKAAQTDADKAIEEIGKMVTEASKEAENASGSADDKKA